MIQIGCILLLLVGLTLLCPRIQKRVSDASRRRLLWCIGVVYCVGNLYFTLLSRTAGTQSHVELIPFRSYLRLFETSEETTEAAVGFAAWFLAGTSPVVGIILNIFLYYPLGYLARQIFPKLNVWWVILIGMLCSIATEATQYFFKMGWCETDDVIHNTLGTAIGVWVWQMQYKHSRTVSQTSFTENAL